MEGYKLFVPITTYPQEIPIIVDQTICPITKDGSSIRLGISNKCIKPKRKPPNAIALWCSPFSNGYLRNKTVKIIPRPITSSQMPGTRNLIKPNHPTTEVSGELISPIGGPKTLSGWIIKSPVMLGRKIAKNRINTEPVMAMKIIFPIGL